MKKKFSVFLLILLSSVCFAEKLPKKMYVAVEDVELKSKISFFSKNIQTLYYGQLVIPLEQSGNFIKIQDSKTKIEGWVSLSSLSKRKIGKSDFTADANELALAGKGFNEEVEKSYKKSGKADYTSVDLMESWVIQQEKLISFIIEGNLKGAE